MRFPATALCGYAKDLHVQGTAVFVPPLWGPLGGVTSICPACWVRLGHGEDALKERQSVRRKQLIERHAAENRFSAYLWAKARGEVGEYYVEDIVEMLRRYEIYETPEFVREALTAIRKARET